jgi:uncharacterized NAD(P)/FAD-binding protein YdhS
MPASFDAAAAVIGGGFSGTMAALQLRRHLPADQPVLLVERDAAAAGRGLAYGTTDPHHLLNVPAGSMSAFPDQPGHFLAWLQGQPRAAFGPLCDGPAPGAFVPRRLFGAYIRELLEAALAQGGLRLATAEIDRLQPLPGGGFRLEGPGLGASARRVVLATGNPPPGRDQLPWLAGDPWGPGALDGIDPGAALLLVGAGLTMADLVLTLRRSRGHHGPIHVVSRHGWAPLPHASLLPAAPWPMPEWPADIPLSSLLRALRQMAREAAAQGVPWQAVPDGLRLQLQRLWRGASLERRQRFARHLRSLWGAHRHRLAPAVAQALAESGIQLRAARLAGWAPAADGVTARLRPRGGGPEERLTVARILLCIGPGEDRGWMGEPPMAGLLAEGLARPDPLGVGLDIDPDSFALRDARGATIPDLYAIGPGLRAVLWEATAVPELRGFAATLAARMA